MKSINIKFPLEDDQEKNNLFRMNFVTKDALVSDLKLLFYTKKGQRYYMPDYGTNLEKFLFEPKDNTTENDIIQDLKQSVKKYMPNITINNVAFYTNVDEGYQDLDETEIRVLIGFTYSDDAFSDSGTIDLTF